MRPSGKTGEDEAMQQNTNGGAAGDEIVCARCGNLGVPLHLGCRFCEECCDCRPLGT